MFLISDLRIMSQQLQVLGTAAVCMVLLTVILRRTKYDLDQAEKRAHILEGLIIASDNIDEVIAWKDGFFHFENADLQSILRQLSRWYDVEVQNEGVISEERYFMIMSRKSSLNSILKALEANDINFGKIC